MSDTTSKSKHRTVLVFKQDYIIDTPSGLQHIPAGTVMERWETSCGYVVYTMGHGLTHLIPHDVFSYVTQEVTTVTVITTVHKTDFLG